MRNTISKITLTATLAVAITLTLSCSGGDDGGNEPSSGSGTAISSSSDGGGGSGLTGTSGTFTDSRDGKSYKWVKIGEQYWMAENLNYDVPGNDTDVCYENAPANCTTYGKLYDWATAVAACPSGWHLPSYDEWNTLIDFAGGATAGNKLKAKSGWNENGNGTGDKGFSALPGGGYKDPFEDVGVAGYWWSSTEQKASQAYRTRMTSYREDVDWNGDNKRNLYSVRCVKD